MSSAIGTNKAILILILSVIVVTGVSIIVVFTTKDNKKRKIRFRHRVNNLTVIKSNKEIVRPNVKLNAELELVKMKNGMTGLLINDNTATKTFVEISMNNGSFIDTDLGISHFGEHMLLQGSEKYSSIYPIFNYLFGLSSSEENAFTAGNFQLYYIKLPNDYQYEKAIDILTDAFRYPLYLPDFIEKEIEAVNHEFYDNLNNPDLEIDIIRQLASNKTGFNGNMGGNNETLKKNESQLLSKKLKGYHMLIKNPNNLFFVLYSNKSLNESEELAKKYMNYEMHQFSDDEIDVEDKKRLEENIKNLKNIEIFDENIYKHGFFYNSWNQTNILKIYYYLGKISIEDLKFDIMNYINYLLNSPSLMKVLREKNYIAMNTKLLADREDILATNDFIYITITLTEEGFNSINEIIKIVNKYIDIMKEEGYTKEYFNNFVHIQNSNNIIRFKKEKLFGTQKNFDSLRDIFINYFLYGDKLFVPGMISEDDYNEELLKKYLNALSFEKSFYSINCEKNIEELDNLDEILKSKETVKLKYYNSNFILGLINDDTEKEVNDKSVTIPNLKIREINEYISTKYNETVIPCYKEQTNTCEEKNEFDYEKEAKYKGTLLEENENYMTFYQIDKSSESHLVYSNLIIYLNEIDETDSRLNDLIEKYINYLLNNFIEFDEAYQARVSSIQMNFQFITFSDNTEKIINKFIDLLVAEPTEEDFESIKIIYIYSLKDSINGTRIDFQSYVGDILEKFQNPTEEEEEEGEKKNLEGINNITYEDFKDYYLNYFNNINSTKFLIAGNIDENLVSNIHSYIKKTFTVKTNKLAKKMKLKANSKNPSVYNYYQKSTLDEAENGIIVSYEIPEEYQGNFTLFKNCFDIISMNYLRFNYTNTYTPFISAKGGFIIYEQGLYKDVDQMEDDINRVLKDILDGKIDVQSYKEIVESLKWSTEIKNDKSIENLFLSFIFDKTISIYINTTTDVTNQIEIPKYPETFKELVEIISPVFTNPNRITILIAKKDLSDEAFEEMFQRRSKITEYPLNKNITIIHTTNITAYEKTNDEDEEEEDSENETNIEENENEEK